MRFSLSLRRSGRSSERAARPLARQPRRRAHPLGAHRRCCLGGLVSTDHRFVARFPEPLWGQMTALCPKHMSVNTLVVNAMERELERLNAAREPSRAEMLQAATEGADAATVPYRR